MSVDLPSEVRFAFALTGYVPPDVDHEVLIASGRRLIAFADTLQRMRGRADGEAGHVTAANAGDGVTAMRDHWTSEQSTSSQTKEVATAALVLASGQISAGFLFAMLKVASVYAAYRLLAWLAKIGFFGAAGVWIFERAVLMTRAALSAMLRGTMTAVKWLFRHIFQRAAIRLEKKEAERLAAQAARPLSETARKPPLSPAERLARELRGDQSAAGKSLEDDELQRQADIWQKAAARPQRPKPKPDA